MRLVYSRESILTVSTRGIVQRVGVRPRHAYARYNVPHEGPCVSSSLARSSDPSMPGASSSAPPLKPVRFLHIRYYADDDGTRCAYRRMDRRLRRRRRCSPSLLRRTVMSRRVWRIAHRPPLLSGQYNDNDDDNDNTRRRRRSSCSRG